MNSSENPPPRLQRVLNTSWVAVMIPALIGLALAFFIIHFLRDYGLSLFLGLPFLVSFLSAFSFSFRREVPFWTTYRVSVLSVLVLGAGIILAAMDGAICLLMALPLTLLIALIGTALASVLATACRGARGTTVPLLLTLTLPGMATVEHAKRPQPETRVVRTSVVIDAPAARVWPVVIAFPRILEPPTDLFRWGVAYPQEARIEGTGVGAVRHCVFSTGSFVEPITVWDEPRRLAFDVTSCPPPMGELSIYTHLDVPHLHGFMVAEHGQFRLIEHDGKMTLEGTTWYHHDLYPAWYWGPISDYVIHRIHQRVLAHIKRTVEDA